MTARPFTLPPVVTHLRGLIAERDRAELARRLMQALHDDLRPQRGALYRIVTHKGAEFAVALAWLTNETIHTGDAYLVSPRHGIPLESALHLRECVTCGHAVTTETQQGQRTLLPLFRHTSVHLLLEVERDTPLDPSETALLEAVAGIFNDHLGLLDYAETDTLTGLLNRKTFDEHLDRLLGTADGDEVADALDHPLRRKAGAAGDSHWLAILDIDHFKSINDTHGHLIGDEVLLILAQLMREAFRLDDQLFRFGGEEFIVVLQPTHLQYARDILERFRRTVEAHNFPIVHQVTVSIGFTAMHPLDNPPDLIDRADKALYYAKDHGRNRVDNYEALRDVLGEPPQRHGSDIEMF